MAEVTGIEDYDPADFPPFAVTVDIVVFTLRHDRLEILLIQRGEPPYEKHWALPGGFVRPDEDLETAAHRELLEETGIESDPAHLAQLGAYGHPDRDPRMRVVTIAWWAIVPDLPDPTPGSDAVYTDLVAVDDVLDGYLELAFDHHQIVTDAVEALRSELEHTTLASTFWKDEFSISDLRRVYEAVWGVELEPGNFQRKVRNTPGWLTPTGERRRGGDSGRPAETFVSGMEEPQPLEKPIRRGRNTKDDES